MSPVSLIFALCIAILSPQFGRAQESVAQPKYELPALPFPNFKVKPNRPDAPEKGYYDITADRSEKEGNVTRHRGNVTIESTEMILKADELDLNDDTHKVEARGHVYFQHYERNEIIVCSHLEYDIETQRGTFYDLRGYTKTKIDARPGMLTSDNPFYFEGKWAERIEDKYVLHDGFITSCTMPNPWWTLHGPKFDIVPEQRALAYRAVYRVRRLPLFYMPFFYKSLKKEPRQSGFLTPNVGNSSTLGQVVGLGYYWAINRSYDVTYRFQDFTSRGYAHHVDFRGKPTAKSDFDVIFYGVQDRGIEVNNTIQKQGGYDIYATGRAEFGDGWTARGNLDYLSTLLFRQNFTQSFNEAVSSESHSTGYISKTFSNYTVNFVASRLENFQDNTPGNFILIRKLPEAQFLSRDQEVVDGPVPLWVSFTSSIGLLYRSTPATFTDPKLQTQQFSQRQNFTPHAMTAFHWGGLHLVPSFTFNETWYNEQILNNRIEDTSLFRKAPEFGLDVIFPSLARVYDKKTIFGEKLKHVIEPRATYRYVTGLSGDYQKVIRYDQTDLLTNTNEVEISITNRIYAKRGAESAEIFTWEIAQKRFFDPTFGGAVVPFQRNVIQSTVDFDSYTFLDGPRRYSPVVSNMRAPLFYGFTVQWQADYDPAVGRLVNTGFSADWRRHKYFASAGQNQVHAGRYEVNGLPVLTPNGNQFRGTVGYGDANRRGWNTAVTGIYDYIKGSLNFATATVNYNTDCCGISVQYRHFNFITRQEDQFRVSFSIANVGSFGNLKKQERLF